MEDKICKTCGELKNINEYGWHTKKDKIYRLDCKICFREKERNAKLEKYLKTDIERANRIIERRNKIKNRGETPIDNKWCYSCEEYKHNDEFSPYNLTHNGCCRECSSMNDIQRNRLLKLKAIKYLGGKCNRCNYIGHYSAYDFHHLNYLEKEFDWGKGRKKTFDKIKPELNKCILLCKNCHAVVHTKLNNDGTLNPEYTPTNL
jgi:hypothetical protein